MFINQLTSEDTPDTPKSILIVDDDGMIVELLSLGFENCRLQSVQGGKRSRCLESFRSRKHRLFVLTDIRMPGMNGEELSHRIRNQSSLTKIAVMTGGETDVATEFLQDKTVDYFFPKPFKIKNICRIIAAEAQIV